jgi:hypothetical protein
MSMWKRLTQDVSSSAVKIDVNMDNVATIVRDGGRNYTRLTFIFAVGDNHNGYNIMVKESPDEILALSPLPSK